MEITIGDSANYIEVEEIYTVISKGWRESELKLYVKIMALLLIIWFVRQSKRELLRDTLKSKSNYKRLY